MIDGGDDLFGEDSIKKFESAYQIEMVIQNTEGFGGDIVNSMYGLDFRKTADLLVSKRTFDKLVGKFTNLKRPKEGDLIWFPMSQGLFEILHVAHEEPFYQLGKLYEYRLHVQLFTYSNERVDTGVSDIDDIEDAFSNDGETISDTYADNDAIETEADENLDFNESNPFGSL